MDSYFDRPEVSNSDLTWLKNQLFPREMPDPTRAFRFGSLLDAIITEPNRVNYFNRTLNGHAPFSEEDFDLAINMKKAFFADSFCLDFLSQSEPQRVMVSHRNLEYNGYAFSLQTRCKFDLWQGSMGCDIKTTTATSHSQFMDAIQFFDYHRQRAWYIDLAGCNNDVVIGISKKNLKIFKVFINRNSAIYQEGREKYLFLAFKWHLLFGETKPINLCEYEIKNID